MYNENLDLPPSEWDEAKKMDAAVTKIIIGK
jgi:hypothetical protein